MLAALAARQARAVALGKAPLTDEVLPQPQPPASAANVAPATDPSGVLFIESVAVALQDLERCADDVVTSHADARPLVAALRTAAALECTGRFEAAAVELETALGAKDDAADPYVFCRRV